jgi:outer membrane lipoprotein-sorting protein
MQRVFLLLIFNFVATAAHAQQLSPAEIKALLERIREKRVSAPQVQADFQEEKVIRLMNKPITSTGKVWFEVPSKFRREVKGNSPSITVCDGQQLWIYYPNFKSVEHYTLGKHSPINAGIAAVTAALNLENVESTYHISANKIDNGYSVELLPRTPSLKRIFQKFDLQMNDELLVTRTEMLQPNGDRLVTIYSNQSRGAIPQSTFEFTPPPGTEVTTPLGR